MYNLYARKTLSYSLYAANEIKDRRIQNTVCRVSVHRDSPFTKPVCLIDPSALIQLISQSNVPLTLALSSCYLHTWVTIDMRGLSPEKNINKVFYFNMLESEMVGA